MARRWPSTCCAPLGELWTRSRRKQIDCCRLVTRADSSRSFVCELRSPEASRVSCRSHRATGHHFSRCRESYTLTRSTRTQHPTPIHLSVLPHGGCGPAPRRKRGSPAILATAPNGWAGLHSTSTTSFAGIILADFQTLQLGGHAIAHISGAGTSGPPSAIDS